MPDTDISKVAHWKGEMTPEMAAKFLEHNKSNRKIAKRHVNWLAHAITSDEWEFDGNPIKLDTQGNLIDGQHRCLACVQTNTPIEVMILRNMAPESQKVMDSGRKRNFADYISMQGYVAHASLANLVKFVYGLETGFLPPHGSMDNRLEPTTTELIARLEKDTDILVEARNLGDQIRYTSGGNTSAVGALWYFCNHIETDEPDALQADINDFFEKFKYGRELAEGSSVLALRRIVAMSNKNRPRMHYQQFALMAKAWNYYRDGKHVQHLLWKQGGASPERMPFPH